MNQKLFFDQLCLWTFVIATSLGVICTVHGVETNSTSNIAASKKLHVMAEQTFGVLIRHCNHTTLKCVIPGNLTFTDIFPKLIERRSQFSEIHKNDTNSTIDHQQTNNATTLPLSPFIPKDWKTFVSPNSQAKHGKRRDAAPTEKYCEGDLINIDCNATSTLQNTNQDAINKELRWADATVPFIIDEKITDEKLRNVILEAMILIANRTCVNFVEENLVVKSDHIVFVRSHQYAAEVGRGSRRIVQILDEPVTSESLGEVQHLLMHVLGFGHEHNRPDRDLFVWINLANIPTEHLLDLANTTGRFAFIETPYDYNSITHFDSFKFARNSSFPTILPKVNGFNVGQRDGLSPTDFYKINTLYECWNYLGNTSEAFSGRMSIGKRHIGEKMVVEDSRMLYGTIAPFTVKFEEPTTTSAPVCPVAVCTCPTTQIPEVTSTAATIPPPTQPPLLVPPLVNPTSVAQPFDASAWQMNKPQNPLDNYVKDVVQNALQGSSVGYLLNKDGGSAFNPNSAGQVGPMAYLQQPQPVPRQMFSPNQNNFAASAPVASYQQPQPQMSFAGFPQIQQQQFPSYPQQHQVPNYG